MPGTAVVWPSVLVSDRPVRGVRLLVSVAVLLPGVGSVTPGGGLTVEIELPSPAAP